MTLREQRKQVAMDLFKNVKKCKRDGITEYVEDEAYFAWAKAREEYEATGCVSFADFRDRSHWSLSGVSYLTGIPIRTLQKYESGECKVANMTAKRLLALMKALELSLDDVQNLIDNE